ncbi:hypothetical protein CGLAU_03010 [Corynebacterium glaucum]|uniref:Beta-N-acetylhexosaminidase n=1 Tax=Corynebacterium glaucum TaxID=187491 RepID=A0A1Q2HUR5_9CORY|nr:hypothetical protein [Corynebacterium glaucum]AQQ14587.1 hypothetical protein CGLAU_03010 [Corynebacterium glaucum]
MARISRAVTAAATIALAASLTACGDNATEQTETATPTPEATATSVDSSSAEVTEATETVSDESEASSEPSISKSSSAARTTVAEERKLVAEVAERFSTLAPAALFSQFESCSATGMAGSFDCSGSEIGQFQFFDSEAKAASTTQLLTELRSSRIVEDKGDRVVGWSVLGTSAIITVVDNTKGQVMQQLISTDQDDPRQRIYELGLADQVNEVKTPGATPRAVETLSATP